MNYRKLEQDERDKVLKEELSEDVVKLIEKFDLKSSPDFEWVARKENSHEHVIFKHRFLKKNDILRALFRVNKLCFAKVNYFSNNIVEFEPQIYDYKKGFIKTELWNTEFLMHKTSGKRLDLRYLQTITEIEKFEELCEYLESFKDNK